MRASCAEANASGSAMPHQLGFGEHGDEMSRRAGRDQDMNQQLGGNAILLYENLKLQVTLEGTRANADLTAALQSSGSLRATMTVTHLTSEAPSLDGRINASMPTLKPFVAFVPTVANLDGTLDAEILVGGTTAAPEITGNIDAQRLQADLGKLGIELRDGRVRGEARSGGGFKLAASGASGKGHLELAGTLDEHGEIKGAWKGEFPGRRYSAASRHDYPDLQPRGIARVICCVVSSRCRRADIICRSCRRTNIQGTLPGDVVVIRNGKVVEPASKASDMPLSAVVTAKLGQNINITGYGLESTVNGELVVREAPGVPTTGSGQLLVAGTYKAYGQDLTIKDGRLLFAGTPLDNPRLAITAMREIDDDLSTGLRIGGSAQRPIITVISDPDVGEADALSYLVTGRSLNDVGSASGSSQDTLASATRSLESAGAGLVAKRIGQRLGIDEAGVEENEMIGGSALTVGEYLSPRLYLSYGVGLFEPGEVVALRYKLTDDIGVHSACTKIRRRRVVPHRKYPLGRPFYDFTKRSHLIGQFWIAVLVKAFWKSSSFTIWRKRRARRYVVMSKCVPRMSSSISSHDTGVDTPTPGRQRGEKAATAVAPKPLRR